MCQARPRCRPAPPPAAPEFVPRCGETPGLLLPDETQPAPPSSQSSQHDTACKPHHCICLLTWVSCQLGACSPQCWQAWHGQRGGGGRLLVAAESRMCLSHAGATFCGSGGAGNTGPAWQGLSEPPRVQEGPGHPGRGSSAWEEPRPWDSPGRCVTALSPSQGVPGQRCPRARVSRGSAEPGLRHSGDVRAGTRRGRSVLRPTAPCQGPAPLPAPVPFPAPLVTSCLIPCSVPSPVSRSQPSVPFPALSPVPLPQSRSRRAPPQGGACTHPGAPTQSLRPLTHGQSSLPGPDPDPHPGPKPSATSLRQTAAASSSSPAPSPPSPATLPAPGSGNHRQTQRCHVFI
ncbi:mucin-1-like [Passer montanus]|uniref:mucin-1-like n=1 Tax=Passer montanus TaxID=9160 RepID=UPI0019609B24|nr:mucin-1-like [Passer montanus]